MHTFDYHRPATLKDAAALLKKTENARPLAGGQSLTPALKMRLAQTPALVDLGALEELRTIKLEAAVLTIGAGVRHSEVAESKDVKIGLPVLAKLAAHIGDRQVRNMGTIGGSVAHNDPSADYPAALQALEAKVVLRSAKGTRTVAIDDFLVDTFTTSIEDGEIVSEIVVPVTSGGTNYQKVYQPASGFAIVGVAVHVTKKGGKVGSASRRADGIAQRGKTKGRLV